MKKLLALVVAFSFVASPLFATQTRIASLGVQNWMVEEDDNLLWMNPARTADYSKQVWVEAVDNAGAAVAPAVANWGGVTGMCPIVDGATVGLFVNRPYWGAIVGAIPTVANELPGITAVPNSNTAPLWPAGFAGGQMVPMAPATRFELLYVLPAMDKLTVGARISSAGDTNNNKMKVSNSPNPVALADGEVTDDRSVQDTVLEIGGKIAEVGPFSVLDVVVNADMPSAKDTAKLDIYTGAALGVINSSNWEMKVNPSTNLSLTARGTLDFKGNPLIVYLNYNGADYSSDFTRQTDANRDGDYLDAGDTDYKQARTQTQKTTTLGAAYNSQLSKKTLLVAGTALASRATVYDVHTTPSVNTQAVLEEKTESTTNAMQLGINLGVEHKVSKVVTGRLGMNQLIMQSTDNSVTQRTYAAAAGSTTAFTEATKNETTGLTETLGVTAVTYGVGLNVLENLTIDALVSQNIEFTGTWLLSGVVQKYVTQVTATYKF